MFRLQEGVKLLAFGEVGEHAHGQRSVGIRGIVADRVDFIPAYTAPQRQNVQPEKKTLISQAFALAQILFRVDMPFSFSERLPHPGPWPIVKTCCQYPVPPKAPARQPGSPRLPPPQHLLSVDALRGFDMFWIIGASSLVYALERMSSTPVTRFLAAQLEHADWEGLHFYDLIFPLFVFIVGVSVVFSLTKTLSASDEPRL